MVLPKSTVMKRMDMPYYIYVMVVMSKEQAINRKMDYLKVAKLMLN